MGKYNEELVYAGLLLAGEGLHPSVKGKRVAFDGPSRTVIDGPSPRPASWSPASGYGRSKTWPRRPSG
jgi:hypothetical protein